MRCCFVLFFFVYLFIFLTVIYFFLCIIPYFYFFDLFMYVLLQAVKMVWQYVKANNLTERGKVQCDDNLKAVFGEDALTEVQLNRKV